MDRGLQLLLGTGAILAGLVLALVPVYAPAPHGEPYPSGTLWYVGVPLAVAGVTLLLLAERRPAA